MMNTLEGFWADSMRARAKRRMTALSQSTPQNQGHDGAADRLVVTRSPRPPQSKPRLPALEKLSISQAGTMLLPVVPTVIPPASLMPEETARPLTFEDVRLVETAITARLVKKAVRTFWERYHWLPEEVLVSQHQLSTVPSGMWEYFPVDLEDIGCYTVFLRLEASMERGEVECVGLPGHWVSAWRMIDEMIVEEVIWKTGRRL